MSAPAHPSTADDWDPHTYPAFTAALGPRYGELHNAMLDASRDLEPSTILDLGTGTGEAARRLLSMHNQATVVGVDANQAMLDAAAVSLAPERATLVRGRLEEPLPPGPFDLVVSVLAVHHLNSQGKADLFTRISDVLAPGGRFVLADDIRDPDAPIHHEPTIKRLSQSLRDYGPSVTRRRIIRKLHHSMRRYRPGVYVDYDQPDPLVDQVAWLTAAGLQPEVVWEKYMCAVVIADKSIAQEASA